MVPDTVTLPLVCIVDGLPTVPSMRIGFVTLNRPALLPTANSTAAPPFTVMAPVPPTVVSGAFVAVPNVAKRTDPSLMSMLPSPIVTPPRTT